MAVGKEIRKQIRSVKNTQKITKAMEMVAASKMRRTQERMRRSRPYADRIRAVIGHLAKAAPEYRNEYMIEREVKRVAFLVVSSDKGLCGGLNVNLFRALVREMRDLSTKGVGIDLGLIGVKAVTFFRVYGGNVVSVASNLGESPSVADLLGVVRVMLDAYTAGNIDRLYIASNRFINTMTQQPTIRLLLPLEPDAAQDFAHHWDYLYEPDAKELIDGLVMRHIESQVYQAVVENAACEQAAKMVAMKSATENAGKLIGELQLIYNKARQAAITQEIAEIVGGAAAV